MISGTSPEPVAVCATHEGAQSTGACPRCGDFICPLCLDERSGLPEHCEACREREGGDLIPFEREDGGLLRRWWQTTRAIVLHPSRTLETARPGSLSASVRYAGLTGVLVAAPLSLLGLAALALLAAFGTFDDALTAEGQDPAEAAGLVIGTVCAVGLYAAMMPALLIVSSVLRAGVFYLSARLVGGTGEFRVGFWALGYLHGISFILLPLTPLQQIPVLGPLLGIAVAACIEIFYGTQLTNLATRVHDLTEGRATFAGWSGFLVVVALASLCCLFGFLAAYAVGA